MRPSLLTTLLLCALTAHTLFRPRFANETDRYSLPSPNAVLAAADVPLGVVTVRLAGRNVTDSEALRAAVLSGLAMSTDWMSVGDATAVRVDATSDERAPTPTTSTPCGTSAPALTYIIALAPAVLPTAAQARQLVDGASSSISKQLAGAKLKDVRVVATDAALDDSLFAARPAPFPQHATAGSDNVMLGWLRATGYGMSLCEVGLTALRTLQRQELVVSAAYIEATAANGTSAAKGLPAPSRRHNLANTRIVRVVPKGHDVNSADVTLDLAAAAGGDVPDVLDMRIAVAGLTSDQAVRDVAAIRAASRSGKLTRELQKTPGLGTASLGHTPDDWFYNGHDLEGDPISSGALAAAITVPTLAAVGLAVGGGVFITRRRRRARVRAAKVAMLAANGLGTGSAGSAGSGKPSELLRAMAQATPTVTDPLARLAAVDWELDPADLEVSTGDDGAEVELGTGANGRVVRGRYTKTGQDVAIKILTRRDDEGRGLEDLSKEIVMLRACRHPNIVSFVGASIRDGVPPILVVELMPRGDLYRALDNPKCRSVFTWQGQLDGGRPRPYTGMNRCVCVWVGWEERRWRKREQSTPSRSSRASFPHTGASRSTSRAAWPTCTRAASSTWTSNRSTCCWRTT